MMNQIPAEFAAEFESVLAVEIGELVDKVIDLVGADNFWKVVKSAQFCEFEAWT